MSRTRSQRASSLRVGLLAALYLVAAVLPMSVAAAEPTEAASSDAPVVTVEPSPTTGPTEEPAPLEPPEVEPSPDPVAASAAPEPQPEPSGEPEPGPAPDGLPTAAPAPTPGPGPTSAPTPGPVPNGQATAAPAAAGAAGRPVPSLAAAQPVGYLVTLRAGTTAVARNATLAAVGAELDTWIPELRIATVLLRAGSATADAAALAADPSVLRIERDHRRDVEAAPADPRSGEQWSLPVIGWERVRDEGLPAGAALVAILDTGVDATHPDLAGRLVPGVSFVDGSPADSDAHGHGTWLTGIVAAAVANDEGIAGIGGSGVRVLPITVLAPDGTGQDSAVIAGLVAAVDAGADVILLAFSNPGASPALQAALDYAWAHDVVLVAANGNDGTLSATYPAGARGVLGIASTERAGRLAPDSNHGPQTFLAAPGVDILTTAAGADRDPLTDDGYRSISGTSAAAAAVAGAAAVLRAFDGDASNAVIVGRLARSAAPVGTRAETGNGRLDLHRALADTATTELKPAGVEGSADGGPFVGPYVAASSLVWSGLGADDNWSTPANWAGLAPVAGDDLVFPDGAARLSNTNDLAAATSFNSITISGSGYTLSGNAIALGIGNLSATGVAATNTINIPMSFAATNTVTVNDADSTLTIGAVISGSGGLIKDGTGTLILGATNTYTGATTLSGGVTLVRTSAALGSVAGATTVVSGATLGVDGSALVIAEPLTLNGAGTSGAGALLNLANSNTWSGAITLGSASTVGSTAGTFTVSATIATAGFLLTVAGAGNTTKSTGAISGTGGVTQTATGTLTLSVANTYTGPTTIDAGILRVGIANAVGSLSALTVAAGATFDLFGFSDILGSLAGAGGVTNTGVAATTLTAGGNNTSTTFSGILAAGVGSIALSKAGVGTLTLSGTNTFPGITTVSAGVLRLQSNAALGTTAGATTVVTGAAIEIDGSGLAIAEPITSIVGTGVAVTGALRNLANANTWSGNITLGATPRINSDGGTLTLSGNIGGAAQALTVGGAGSTIIQGVIATTTGTLTKDGVGTLTLEGVDTYTGLTAINAGTLRLGVTNAIGPSSAVTVLVGATFDLAGFSDTIGSLAGAGSVTSSAAGAVTLTAGGNNTSTTFSGVLSDGSGTLALTKVGTLILTLSGVNTYTGVTTINAGTVSIAANANLGTAPGSPTPGHLTLAGGILAVSTTMTLDPNRGIAIVGAGSISPTLIATYGGVIAGAGTLTKAGAGTLILSGVNTYTGATFITAGILSIAADSALGAVPGATTPGHLTIGTGTLLVTANLTLDPARGIALTGTATISPNTSVTFTYGGVVAGAGNLTKAGLGILVLSGVNTYTGITTLTLGVLSIAADTALGTAPGSPTAGRLVFNAGTLQPNASFTIDANRGIALTSTATFLINAGLTLTYAGVIAGASTLTKTGAGTLSLSGANTYAGITTLTTGVLHLGSSTALGTTAGGVTVASATAIEIDGSGLVIAEPITSIQGTGIAGTGALRNLANDNTWSGSMVVSTAGATVTSDGGTLTLAGAITGATRALSVAGIGNTTITGVIGTTTGTLTKTGTGTLTLSGVSTYTGLTAINAGRLKLGVTNAIASSAVTVLAGATFDLFGFSDAIGSLAGAGSVTSTAAGAMTLTTGGNATSTTFSGVASDGSGTLSLTKVGAGTLTLSGANTYTGVTTINAGTVSVASDTNLGTAPASPTAGQLVFGGGILLASASFTLNANRGIALTGAGTISITTALTLTYGGIIAGPGALTKVGAGTVVLSGVNTYTGSTSVTGGVLSIAADSALGTAPGTPTAGQLTFNAGTLLATASFTLDANRGIALTGAGTLSTGTGVTLTYGGVIAGTGLLTKTLLGTLVLTGTNTYTGATSISGGTVAIAADAALGTAPGVPTAGRLTFSTGTLLVSSSFTLDANRGIALTGTGTISTNPGVTLAYAGIIAGASSLTKLGTGMLVLGGVNTYTGLTAVNAGTLRLGVTNAIGPSSALTVLVGATLDLAGFSDTIGSLAGAGGVTSSAAGAVTLTAGGNNTSTTFSGVLSDGSGTVALTKVGTLILTLSGVNTYTGVTTINAGTVSIAADTNLGTAPGSPTPGRLTFGGGTLLVSTTLTFNANRGIALSGAGTISPNTSVTFTYGGVIAGTGTLTKAGAGTLILSGVNTYTGATVVNVGTLSIAADSALGTAPGTPTPSHLRFGGGTLLVSANMTIDSNRGIALTGAGTISPNTSRTVTYGGVIAGAGLLTKTGVGTLILNGVNTYTGATSITGGTLVIAADSALGTAPGVPTAGRLTFSAGTLQTTSSMTLDANRGIALTGIGTFSTNAGVTLTYGGIIAGASSLTKTGTGTLVLSGTNTFTGITTLTSGTLSVAADSGLGTPPAVTTTGRLVFGGGTLLVTASFALATQRGVALTGTGTISTDPSVTFTYGGIIAGASTLTKTGTGTLTLSGVNTYTGATTINAGILSIAADSGIGTAPAVATVGHLTFGGGTLQTTAGFTLSPNRGIALNSGGGTFDVASGTTLVYSGAATGTGTLIKTSAGPLDLSGASATVGGVTISGGTLLGSNAGSFAVTGPWTNDASASAFTGGTGTVTLSGTSPQAMGGSFPTTFNSLTISNATGVTLGADATVNGTLTFTTGNVTTGSNAIYIAASGSVARTSGHVVGNLRKHVSTGAPSRTFEVGDTSIYAPVTVDFASVTVAGDLTVSTTATDHPAIASSTIDPSQSANRFWTLGDGGITFTTYDATFTFVAGDLDPAVDPLTLVVAGYSGGTWSPQLTGTRTLTSTQATGISSLGDFAIGVLTGSAFDHFNVSAPASVTAGTPFDVTVTLVDSVGNTLTGYTGTISFASTDGYASLPSAYTFLPADAGSKTFTGGAVLKVAGSQTIGVSDAFASGTSAPIAVGPGAFTQLQVLAPGDVAMPGSPSGLSGTPSTQVVNAPFTVTVRAVDAYWNPVSSTDTAAITSSDAAAVLPPNAALIAGVGTFSVSLQTGGSATVTATDFTDGSKTAGVSSAISVTDTAPFATADSYSVTESNTLLVAAVGVLSNDGDAEGQAVLVAAPRPVSGPLHGTLTLDADGSFIYTPDPGYVGLDTFTYAVSAGTLTSSAATVTIDVTSAAFQTSDWSTTFDSSRYLALTFPAYVPAGSSVTGATFRHTYRSDTVGDTTCYFFEVYDGPTLLATKGSAGTPVSCNATSSFVADAIALPEIDTVAEANNATIVLYVWNSGGRASLHRLATLGVDYSQD